MNSSVHGSVYGRSQNSSQLLRNSFILLDDGINIDEPLESRSAAQIKIALDSQRNSLEMSSYFRNSNIQDIQSTDVDSYLTDRLFEQRRPAKGHKHTKTSNIEAILSRQGRLQGQGLRSGAGSFVGSSERSSPEPKRPSVTKAEARQKAINNMQSYLMKSYETYRNNFYNNAQNNRPAPQSPPNKEPTSPSSSNSPSIIRRLFPATFAKKDQMQAKRKEEPVSYVDACQFVDYYTSEPKISLKEKSLYDRPVDTIKNKARQVRFFKIDVGSNLTKETKPSISTQASGGSMYHIN